MSGFKKTPNCKPIINITIDDELLEKIEEFRFSRRLQNRSQAFRELVEYGFEFISNQEEQETSAYVSFKEAINALFNGKRVWCHQRNFNRGYEIRNGGELWFYSTKVKEWIKSNHMHIDDIAVEIGWTIEGD